LVRKVIAWYEDRARLPHQGKGAVESEEGKCPHSFKKFHEKRKERGELSALMGRHVEKILYKMRNIKCIIFRLKVITTGEEKGND
jgi:hypothetical protein